MSREKTIGPFTKGEIPPPLEITFTDSTGTAIDLEDFDAVWVVKDTATGEQTSSDAEPIVDGSDGVTVYTWVEGDLDTAGRFIGQMWADDGQQRYASEPFHFRVYDHTSSPFPVESP